MSKREMTVEYLREMVKKSFANVDIDEKGKMCVLPFQSLVDTVDFYEDKLALQEVDIQQLAKENAGLKERNYWLESQHQYECEKAYFEGVEKGGKDTAKEIFQWFFCRRNTYDYSNKYQIRIGEDEFECVCEYYVGEVIK